MCRFRMDSRPCREINRLRLLEKWAAWEEWVEWEVWEEWEVWAAVAAAWEACSADQKLRPS